MKKLKKCIIVSLILSILFAISAVVKADIKVLVNNEPVLFDSKPIIKDGRTLVPLRAIFEKLGATVDWNDSEKTINALKDDKTLLLTIGSKAAFVNGERKELDVAPEISGGRTLVPVRFIGESLECTVNWDDKTRTVNIYEKGFVLNKLRIHYLDVGQGDSEFIELPSGKTILIDAANPDDGEKIGDYIHSLGYQKIDVLIATHPHADHIGGMEYIVNHFEIGKVYMPNAVSSTSTFTKLLNAIDKKNIETIEAKKGVKIDDNLCDLEFLSPNRKEYKNLNNYSAVLKITYGNTSFLFMGDAEKEAEDEIKADVSADIIKIGHHGSSSSSGESFIKRVNPKFAVISCGLNNSYGHPHEETISLLNSLGVVVLRTDELGTIVAESGGEAVLVNKSSYPIKENAPPSDSENTASNTTDAPSVAEQNEPVQKADGNTTVYVTSKGKKYHSDGCSSLKKSKIPITLSEARLEYSPCSKCHPPE